LWFVTRDDHDPLVTSFPTGSWHPPAEGRWIPLDEVDAIVLRSALPTGCHEPGAPEAREVVVVPRSKFHEIPRRETPGAARRSFLAAVAAAAAHSGVSGRSAQNLR